jgi:nicotinate-nucleotide pyrophosphorylase (carboxylating)
MPPARRLPPPLGPATTTGVIASCRMASSRRRIFAGVDASFDPPPHAVADAVSRALAEDLGPLGDLTAALVPPDAKVAAALRARASGVLAGTACVQETFRQVDATIIVTWSLSDGERLEPETAVATVQGPLGSVLTAKRTALNFLCHLSGVATLTRSFVDAAASAHPSTRV